MTPTVYYFPSILKVTIPAGKSELWMESAKCTCNVNIVNSIKQLGFAEV